ncbi:hypothetical protein [Aureibacter tunicatorum]|uniref:Uncharacterized protein n=1 Tax=Aureibacter tunicatorum TaxID=866807 RepID=A0AAE3XPI2_9BACT|nr:hypothetical protein [Aureibacter tunicatorum]MDR6238894.1 hypothetical protein [Aureibacter tunicatorum]BDD05179.1 hypothetical protein AUTU_26620 [Aureibacter tunicatorum]
MNKKVKEYKLWFYCEMTFNNLSQFFFDRGLINDFEYDYENVYEWIETSLYDDSYELNISRKHLFDHELDRISIIEPTSILVIYENEEPDDALIDELAKKINQVLEIPVYSGKINYLGDDDYEYIVEAEYSSK